MPNLLSFATSTLTFLGLFSNFTWNALIGMRRIHKRVHILFHQLPFIGTQYFAGLW